MRRPRLLQFLLLMASILVAVVASEIGLRSLVVPSRISYGTLGGGELPPLRIICDGSFADVDRSQWYDELVVDGKKITRGDLWGILREHETIGYVPQEDSTSVNGWWQSNNLGARSRHDLQPAPPEGVQRVLVFGDSYAQGSRLRQEQTWTATLDELSNTTQIVNFGVDGYGMTQSFLRYRDLRDRLDYDAVLLMFVPSADLVRDVNVHRSLLGWQASIVLSRFIVTDGRLELVPRLYDSLEEVKQHNLDGVGDELRQHLRAYDRAYFRAKYESAPVIGRLVVYKLLARARYSRLEKELADGLMRSDSEAMKVARGILETLASEVIAVGKRFVLVLLPTDHDVRRYETTPAYREQWDAMVATVCPPATLCIDLMDGLRAAAELDRGYDGSHYGPLVSATIAREVWNRLAPELEDQ